MPKETFLFLVAARGGSKRVLGKNLAEIEGISLIGFKVVSAKRSSYCTHLAISTDSPEIASVATDYGVDVPFMRPTHLATDTAKSDDVVLHAMDYFEHEQGRVFNAVVLLEPASPFARASDYDNAVEMFLRSDASLVVGMREMEVNSIYTGPLGPDGQAEKIIEKFTNRSDLRGQSLEPEYTMNGALYIIGWKHMRNTGSIYGDTKNTYGYVMDRFHSMEIETPPDLVLARLLAESGVIEMSDWR